MDNVKNCRRCGKMYQAIFGKNICPECVKQEEVDFEVARDYVKEHPGSSMQKVSDETGVPVNLLLKFVKEGKIDFSDGESVVAACESCGVPVFSGRYCNNCLSQMGKQIMEGGQLSPEMKKSADTSPNQQGMRLSKLKK